MTQQLHSEMKIKSAEKPAGYLRTIFLSKYLVDAFFKSIITIEGASIPAGGAVLAGRLASAEITEKYFEPTLVEDPDFDPGTKLPGTVFFSFNTDISIVCDIHLTKDSSKIISELTILLTDLRIRISAEDNKLKVSGVSYDVGSLDIYTKPDAADILAANGIEEHEAARVEGLIAYSVVPNAIRSTLGQPRDLDLKEIFPAFSFGSAVQLYPMVGGHFLGIVPGDDYSLDDSSICVCNRNPPLAMSPGKIVGNGSLSDPVSEGDLIADVELGGPQPENVDPLTDLGLRAEGVGTVGVYLPKTVQRRMLTKPIPSVTLPFSDNGFIGYSGRAIVGFKDFELGFDSIGRGITVRIELDISATASCTLDMGSGIRQPIGVVLVEPRMPSNPYVELGFYPVVDLDGIRLRAVLRSIDPGRYQATVLGVGAALSLIGIVPLKGFIVDVILSLMLSQGIPELLKKEIKDFMSEAEWPLISASDIVSLLYGPDVGRAAYDDIDNDSALIGYDQIG